VSAFQLYLYILYKYCNKSRVAQTLCLAFTYLVLAKFNYCYPTLSQLVIMGSSDVFYFVNAIPDQDGVKQRYTAGSAVLRYDEFHMQSLNGNEKHQQSTFVPPTTEKVAQHYQFYNWEGKMLSKAIAFDLSQR
jgi:hypothetical protein